MFIRQFLENLHVLALLDVLGADVGDEGTDTINVVGDDHAANSFDKDHAQSFLVADWTEASETDCKHN
jgi:hypothetical protein